jgi:hypothetical protein
MVTAGPPVGAPQPLIFVGPFASAFQTHGTLVGTDNKFWSGTGLLTQNIPGPIFNSGSSFLSVPPTSNSGLADWGTRLKAVFSNIPAGLRLFVNSGSAPNTSPAPLVTNAVTPSIPSPRAPTLSITQPALLYPFVTDFNRIEAGPAVSNPIQNPFGPPPPGTGNGINFYSPGTFIGSGFQGCMIAICNRDNLHVSSFDGLAREYLPLISGAPPPPPPR